MRACDVAAQNHRSFTELVHVRDMNADAEERDIAARAITMD
jgi:hypothetical protein